MKFGNKRFVSRGGIKLEHALKTFDVNVFGLDVLDVGSSTGGFVDCLLKYGAAKIYSVDTAYGELAWKLRQDSRVVTLERQNILYLESLPEQMDLITIDVTFTSLMKILPVVKKFLKDTGKIIALLKPQYEDQKLALGNKGKIPEESRNEILNKVIRFAEGMGYKISGQIESPILGTGGNKEYLVYLSV